MIVGGGTADHVGAELPLATLPESSRTVSVPPWAFWSHRPSIAVALCRWNSKQFGRLRLRSGHATVARLLADPSSATKGLQHDCERKDNKEKFVSEAGTKHAYASRTRQNQGKAYREQDKFHVELQSSLTAGSP